MSKELVLILADSLREYYDENELRQVCALFDQELEYDDAHQKPDYITFARRLITQREHGNNRRILEALLPSISTRCSEMVGKNKYELREYHLDMQSRVSQLQQLVECEKIPSEVVVPDDRPFTAKSEVRELLSRAETDVLLVDAYIGLGTLDCLREVSHPIRILTGQRKESIQQGFETGVSDFRNEGHSIEVRRHPKLHDRYIVFNERCWLVGSSIKDVGKKALNIVECIDSKEAIVRQAEKKWDEADKYL